MGLYSIKPRFQNLIKTLVQISIRRNIHPDLYTYGAVLASVLAVLSIWLGYNSSSVYLLLIFPLLFIRILFNALDGLVARAQNVADPLGRVKNEFGDRVSDVIVISGLFFVPDINVHLVAAILALTLLSSYLGILGAKRIYAGIMAKADRMLLLVAFFTINAFVSNPIINYGFLALIILGLLQTIFIRLRILAEENDQ